jgi:hypothetical protein
VIHVAPPPPSAMNHGRGRRPIEAHRNAAPPPPPMAAAAAAAARYSLVGQGALVTGATKGIGLAIAKELVELGATVVACARTVDSAATAALPAGVHAVQADVASRSGREALMATAEELLRESGTPLSILVNSEAQAAICLCSAWRCRAALAAAD